MTSVPTRGPNEPRDDDTWALSIFEKGELNVSFYDLASLERFLWIQYPSLVDLCFIAPHRALRHTHDLPFTYVRPIATLYDPHEHTCTNRTQGTRSLRVQDMNVMCSTVRWASSYKFDAAKRYFARGQHYKARKMIFLAFRYVVLTSQVT